MSPRLSDVKYWVGRAEEARVMAETLKDPEARRILFDIAKGYDFMAHCAEKHLTGDDPEDMAG